jgi:ABC-type dipeptide/oligopeptide/nickel transport system permease subunit
MSAALPSVVYQLGVGGIGGFIVGYTIKKISKLIVVLIGLVHNFPSLPRHKRDDKRKLQRTLEGTS